MLSKGQIPSHFFKSVAVKPMIHDGYFDRNFVMAAGKWVRIDDKWYYFYGDGTLAINTAIDGYLVDDKGALIKD